jgi:uncharacterized small protein (DUF1192 family)
MAAIDADRYQALVAALKNSIDTSVPFATLQDAHARASRARVDLETFQERGAVGQRGQRRHPDLETTYQQSVSELEQRLAAADREVKRIEALQRQSAAQRANLHRLLDGVKKWAADNAIILPDQDDSVHMPGFAGPSSVVIPTPSSTARSWP